MSCRPCLVSAALPVCGAEYTDPSWLPEDPRIADPAAVYRPRHPVKTVFSRLFQDHFDSYVRAYQERFEPRSGPPRPVVVRSVEEFLACGRLQGGFARIRCPKCRAEHLLVFSCRTRNFCASCQAKPSLLYTEKLTTEILAPCSRTSYFLSFTLPWLGIVRPGSKM